MMPSCRIPEAGTPVGGTGGANRIPEAGTPVGGTGGAKAKEEKARSCAVAHAPAG